MRLKQGFSLVFTGVILLALAMAGFGSTAAAEKKAAPKKEAAKAAPKSSTKGSGTKKSSKKAVKEEAAPGRTPWPLREHYTFSGGPLRLDYSKIDAEWRIRVDNGGTDLQNPEVLVRDIGFSIELADGRILSHAELGIPESTLTRESFTHEVLGKGCYYIVHLVPKNGIAVSYRLAAFNNWPFLLLTPMITNGGEAPIDIKKINSAIFNPGAISGLSAQTQVKGRQVSVRGGLAVYDKNVLPTKMVFNDPLRGYGFTFALAPSGHGQCGIDLKSIGNSWQGSIVSDYAPGFRLKPQETLEADTLFIAFGNQETMNDVNYSWMLSLLKWPVLPKDAPRAWVTVPDTEDFSALEQAAKNAASLGVHYALIPRNWEGKPGTLEGAAPRYPKNIAKAAKELRDAGFTPGLTVDPLAVQGGDAAWTAQSADGQQWANPAHPDAAAFMMKRMEELVKSFGFMVVDRSHIPDEVLAQFGISRAEADWRSLGVVSAAAQASGKAIAVYPVRETVLKAERDAWLEAASAICRMDEYDVTVGPIGFDINGLAGLDEEMATALQLYPGVIELIGNPAAGGRNALAAALAAPSLHGRPQDAARISPLLWEAPMHSPGVGEMGVNLLSFAGAEACSLKGLEIIKDTPSFLWRPNGDGVVAPENNEIPLSNQFTVYGLCPELTRPTFMGVSDSHTFGLDRVSALAWDDAKGLLNVTVEGIRKDAQGYVLITPGWAVKSVKIGKEKVKSKTDGKWLIFPVSAGTANITVEFEKAK